MPRHCFDIGRYLLIYIKANGGGRVVQAAHNHYFDYNERFKRRNTVEDDVIHLGIRAVQIGNLIFYC